MNKYEYKEPEFRVVKVKAQDVITTSIPQASSGWDTGGSGVPIIPL